MNKATKKMQTMGDPMWSHGFVTGIIDSLKLVGASGNESLFRTIVNQTFGTELDDLISVAGDEPDGEIWTYLESYGYST